MIIQRALHADQELWEALQRLVPQLTDVHPPPDHHELEALLASPSSVLLVARQPDADGPIIAALTLLMYRVPTGLRARIEDVVVDRERRAVGIGEALTRHALEIARQAGADGVALTSNPNREAANRLYQRLGFKQRETNVYFYKFE